MSAPRGPIWDSAAECMSPEQRAAVQWDGVRGLLSWLAERSPMYRERLRGIDLAALRSLDDVVAAVPMTTKDDLRAAMDRHATALPHLCVPRSEIVLAGPSAGTSGRQTYQAFDARDLDRNVEIMARLYWCSGMRADDVLQLLITAFTPAADIFRLAAQRVGVRWVIRDNHEPTQVQRYGNVARALGPTYLQAGVGTLRIMAQQARARPELGPLPYRRAVLMGAALGPEARQQFHSDLGIEIHTLSGQGSDFNLFGSDCDAHDGDHWHGEDLTWVEVIDPATGRAAGEGEVGEMVITDFYRRATPHLRWRTEDMVRIHAGRCRCGRTTRRFTLLDRLANEVPVVGGTVFPYQIEAALSRSPDGRNLEFALVRRDAPGTVLELRLLRPEPAPSAEEEVGLALRLERHLAAEIGLAVRIAFHADLPRVGYKTLRVVNETD